MTGWFRTHVIDSLTGRFILLALPIFLLINASGLAAYYEYRKTALDEQLAAEVAAISVRLARLASRSMEKQDLRGLKTVAASMAGNRSIQCVEFRAADGSGLVSWPSWSCVSSNRGLSELSLPLNRSGSHPGEVTIFYNDGWATRTLDRELFYIAVAIAFAGLAAFLAAFLAHIRIIGRPIDALQQAIAHRRSTGERVPADANSFGTLQRILLSYNCMLEREAELEAQTEESQLAEREAKATSSAKSRFLATVSHELRTPMNVIIGLGEVLEDTNLSADQRSYLAEMSRAADTSLRLITDILDFTRAGNGQNVLITAPFPLRETLKAAFDCHRAKAHEKDLDFTFRSAPDLPSLVKGDAVRLQQVVSNLIENAIKFTDHGYVTVSARLISEQTNVMQVQIRDSGVGIDAAHAERLFDPFTQADESNARKAQGLGLGLAICRDLTLLMKGDLTFESKQGEGTVFTLTIPLDCTVQPVGRHISGERPEVEDNAPVVKVLAVDDSPSNLKVIEALLSKEAIELEKAGSGAEALAKISSGKEYDIVLMDIQMPQMSGLETARRIRALGGQPVPIVAVTANATEDDAASYGAAGIDDLLKKPLRKAKLLDLMRNLRTVSTATH